MKVVVTVAEKRIVISIDENKFSDIDSDQITSIDYSNIYGEVVTVPAVLNRIGVMRAEAESEYQKRKLILQVTEADARKGLRYEASKNGNKFLSEVSGEMVPIKMTEKSLEEAVVSDKDIILLREEVIDAEKAFKVLDNLFWAISSKDKKLNNLMKAVTPEDFLGNLVEGRINGIMIKKSRR